MRKLFFICCILFANGSLAFGQTAEEFIARNLQARGGIKKIMSIKSLRMKGRYQQQNFSAQIGEEAKAPDRLRDTFTMQGMTQIQAYDGAVGWKISPFAGRKDPELLGEDALREIVEEADFYGPLVDWKAKGEKAEYLGHDTIDGDDVYRLKLTLKNGDILYYYLDPDTFLEIRLEKIQFLRGAIKETVTDLGSYKKVDGVYFPYSIESGLKGDMRGKITIESMEANVDVPDSQFKMPAAAGGRK